MSKNKSELDICPFCGSDAELVEVDEGLFVVRCTQCNSSGDYYETAFGAQAAWDDRSKYLEIKCSIKSCMSIGIKAGLIGFCLYVLFVSLFELII